MSSAAEPIRARPSRLMPSAGIGTRAQAARRLFDGYGGADRLRSTRSERRLSGTWPELDVADVARHRLHFRLAWAFHLAAGGPRTAHGGAARGGMIGKLT